MRIRYIVPVIIFILGILLVPSAFSLEATYYADTFEGRGTANGDRFSQAHHSAALCNEELGTYAYVMAGGTGMVVTLNDRPNCRSNSDVVDLSSSAFEVFAPLSRGRLYDMNVSLIGTNTTKTPKKTFENTVFSTLGVELTKPLSNTYFAGDGILIKGRVLDGKEYVMIYLQSLTDQREYSSLVRVDANGKFNFPFSLPEGAGKYYFVLSSGRSFETNTPEVLVLLDKNSLDYPEIPNGSRTIRPTITEGTSPYIALPENTWGKLTLTQGDKKYQVSGTTIIPRVNSFKTGTASVLIEGYSLSTPSSLDRSLAYNQLWSGSIILDKTHDSSGKEKVTILNKQFSKSFKFRVPLGEKITSTYYLTLPNGDVRKYSFDKKWLDEEGLFLRQGAVVSGSFGTRQPGPYKFETVLESGFAYFNISLSQGTVWSVLETLSQSERRTLRSKLSLVRDSGFARINEVRKGVGKSPLVLDDTLNTLAQAKAEYMAKNDYIQHKTKEGLDIGGMATAMKLSITGKLYENIAGGNVSDIFLQEGLEESGSHKHAMLLGEVKKVGIGYILLKGKTYLAQVFSE